MGGGIQQLSYGDFPIALQDVDLFIIDINCFILLYCRKDRCACITLCTQTHPKRPRVTSAAPKRRTWKNQQTMKKQRNLRRRKM